MRLKMFTQPLLAVLLSIFVSAPTTLPAPAAAIPVSPYEGLYVLAKASCNTDADALTLARAITHTKGGVSFIEQLASLIEARRCKNELTDPALFDFHDIVTYVSKKDWSRHRVVTDGCIAQVMYRNAGHYELNPEADPLRYLVDLRGPKCPA